MKMHNIIFLVVAIVSILLGSFIRWVAKDKIVFDVSIQVDADYRLAEKVDSFGDDWTYEYKVNNDVNSEDIDVVLSLIKGILPNANTLYGGSANEENIDYLKTSKLIDGYLLGGLSLKPEKLKIKMSLRTSDRCHWCGNLLQNVDISIINGRVALILQHALILCLRLVFFQFPLCAIGTDDIGVVQLTGQAGLHIVNVNSAQTVPFCQFFLVQTFGLGLGCQFVDSCNHCIYIHKNKSFRCSAPIIPQLSRNARMFCLL